MGQVIKFDSNAFQVNVLVEFPNESRMNTVDRLFLDRLNSDSTNSPVHAENQTNELPTIFQVQKLQNSSLKNSFQTKSLHYRLFTKQIKSVNIIFQFHFFEYE